VEGVSKDDRVRGWRVEGDIYHSDPYVNCAIGEEPVEKGSLGWHHVGVLLRLLLFFFFCAQRD
jgi:hypothetical protein